MKLNLKKGNVEVEKSINRKQKNGRENQERLNADSFRR